MEITWPSVRTVIGFFGADNEIESVTQDNTANGANDASFIQLNDITSIQAFDIENDCNESEDGNNDVSCDSDMDNGIETLSQSNVATGSGNADIFQNNEIDGNDAEGIPGINQILVTDNS